MAFYGSTQWLNMLQESVNNDPKFAKEAAKLETSILTVTEIKNLPKPVYIWIDIHKGKMREWAYLTDAKERRAEFTMATNYWTWKDLCQGKLDGMQAFTSGKMKIKGSKVKLLQLNKQLMLMLKIMTSLPTDFVDEMFMQQ